MKWLWVISGRDPKQEETQKRGRVAGKNQYPGSDENIVSVFNWVWGGDGVQQRHLQHVLGVPWAGGVGRGWGGDGVQQRPLLPT